MISALVTLAMLSAISSAGAFEFPQDTDSHTHVATTVPSTPRTCGTPTGVGGHYWGEAAPTQADPYATSVNPLGSQADYAAANAPDHKWVENEGNDALVFDFGPNLAADNIDLYPFIDHPLVAGDPFNTEALEATVYGTDNPNQAFPPTGVNQVGGWEAGNITTIYDPGFDASVPSDDYVTTWHFSKPYQYYAVQHGGPGAAHSDGDNEVDALCAQKVPALVTGRILVEKKTVPAGDTTNFMFTPSYNNGATFLLNGTSPANDSGELLTNQTYSVAETTQAGWTQTSATCSNGSPITAIVVPPNAAVTCTFTNTKNAPPTGKIAPTQTTCQQYTNGTALTEPAVYYQQKGTNIGSVSPGVIFYYSKVTVTSSSATIVVDQTNPIGPAYDFSPQNVSNVRLYTANCTQIPASVTITGGDVSIGVTGATPGTYIVSVKYSPNSIGGLAAPASSPVPYTYQTKLGATTVDSAGINLVKK